MRSRPWRAADIDHPAGHDRLRPFMRVQKIGCWFAIAWMCAVLAPNARLFIDAEPGLREIPLK